MNDIYAIGTPICIPEGLSEPQLRRMATIVFETFSERLLDAILEFLERRGRETFLWLEERVQHVLAVVGSHILGGVLVALHEDQEWVDSSVAAAHEQTSRPLRHRGTKSTPVRFLGGARLSVSTPYLSEDRTQRRGRRRGVGRRGPTGTGCYPALEALGILNRATPALASEVAKQSVRNASFDEAQEALAERGIVLDKKSVRDLTLKVGGAAIEQREARIEAAAQGLVFSEEFVGKRVVISTDGGRLRTREGGKHGRKGKKGRRGFRTPWREPKLVTAYLIDRTGKKVSAEVPLYDGTLGDADAAFEILLAELRLRGAARAKEIILVADGARWIWNRADDLVKGLGLSPKQLVKVADFYHAVEHLADIADLCASWSSDHRKRWVKRMRRLLKKGKVEKVIEAARELCQGRNAKKIRTEVNYFVERKDYMQYKRFRRRGLPLGSGAVESAIRRVVNLRLKGPAIFWRGPNAERMLHLRCYLKAGALR
jgi:hypothetical protein